MNELLAAAKEADGDSKKLKLTLGSLRTFIATAAGVSAFLFSSAREASMSGPSLKKSPTNISVKLAHQKNGASKL